MNMLPTNILALALLASGVSHVLLILWIIRKSYRHNALKTSWTRACRERSHLQTCWNRETNCKPLPPLPILITRGGWNHGAEVL